MFLKQGSAYIPLKFEKGAFEFVYTIITQTFGVLINVITEQTQELYKKVLGLLNKERIIFWDTDSGDKFKSFCKDYIPTEILD
jgi:hypothetical protein